MAQLVSYTYTHWRARTHAYRQACMHTCVHVYLPTYMHPMQKAKNSDENGQKADPPSRFQVVSVVRPSA